MRPVKDETLDELEDTAVESARAIRAYLKYQGTNKDYEQKARVAAAAISSFARARASETNRAGIELMAERMGLGAGTAPMRLKAAK